MGTATTEAGDYARRREVGLATAASPEAQAETLTLALKAAECMDGRAAFVHQWDPVGHRLSLVAAIGPAAESAEGWAELPEERDVAPVRAIRSGEYAWAVESPDPGAAGTAAVPLLGAHGPFGVLSVITAGEPDEARRSFLCSVAAWSGAHLGEVLDAPPVRRSPAGAERTVRMGKLTAALAEAVTSREVVRAVAAYVLPPFGADGLIVWVFESGRQHVVDSAGYTDEFLDLLDDLAVTDYPVAEDVFRTCAPRFIESAAEYTRRYPALSQIPAAAQKNAWAFLPMIASGHAIGMCLVSFTRQRSFTDEERTLLTALSGLVGQSLERARLYDVEHARAQELQRSLLPRTLPRLPAACAAARYLPAGRGEQVGGDWYDVIQLPADRVAMVIGDVMGHGIPEAATMGQLRTVVRTLADLDIPPDELLTRLNDLVGDLGEDYYATCLYAVFDPITRVCSLSLAGHPPPVVVHPDGTVQLLDLTADPPLGAAEPPFETHQVVLPEQSLLVLYTDGLVESATRAIDQGLERLQQLLARHAAPVFAAPDEDDDVQRLDELCDSLVAGLLPDHGRTSDDAALLIAHTRAIDAGDVVSWTLPEDPRAAGQAREHIRSQLAVWGLEDLASTTELLASELIGNVIRHAKGPVRLRLLRSRTLTCEVYDGSLTTPRIRHASYFDEGGRGLQLVAALSRRWGARYNREGKCIWTEQDIPRRPAVHG